MDMNGERRLEGRRILITGAAQGIGQAAAERFAREGASLALVDLKKDQLETVAHSLGATAIACDVSDEGQVTETVAAAVTALGGLDGLVNAAGILGPSLTVEDSRMHDWTTALSVNLTGPYLICRSAIPALRRADKATIVNVASIGALRPARGVSAYCASKAGLLMLSKCLAFELGPNIRVNSVCPGTTVTDMMAPLLADAAVSERLMKGNALGRFSSPAEIAEALLFLTSHESSFTNGATLVVDGGYIWH